MKKFLAALGAIVFIGGSALVSTGAPIPLLTGPNSGCNEASQLLFCLNGLISILNGSTGTTISFGAGATGSTTSLRSGTAPNPQTPGGIGQPLGPGTGVCLAGSTTAECGSPFTPVVSNGQRGIVTFNAPIGGLNTLASGGQANSSTLMVMNSFMAAGANCQANIVSQTASTLTTGGGDTANSANIVPFVAELTPTTGIWSGTTSQNVLLIRLGNASGFPAQTMAYQIAFWCQ